MIQIVHLKSSPENIDYYKKKLSKVADYRVHIKNKITSKEALKLTSKADVLILSPLAIKSADGSFINNLDCVKHIALTTSGYDWIDLKACKNKEISVSCAAGANAEAVAEHIFGFFIDLAKRITVNDRNFRLNKVSVKYPGKELYCKTLGIVGLGNIGHKLVRIAQGFEMKVLAYDRSETSTSRYEIVALKKILKLSDFLAICIPLFDSTEKLIGMNEVSLMKNQIVIANISRDKVIDKSAIITGIKSGRIFGYGVDIEKFDKKLTKFYSDYPNIIVNIHNAFNSLESARKTRQIVVENVLAYIKRNKR